MKKWWMGLLAISLMGLLVWGMNYAVDSQQFQITRVNIKGDLMYLQRADLKKAVVEKMNGNFFQINLDEIRMNVKKLAWVADVEIRRVWPDSLVVSVNERKAVAVWELGGFIDETGHLYKPGNAPVLSQLVKLSGPSGTQKMMLESMHMFSGALNEINETMTQIWMDGRRAWKILLQNGTEVILGRENVLQRLGMYIEAIPLLRKQNPEKYTSKVDMRYPNGFAIRWTDISSVSVQ